MSTFFTILKRSLAGFGRNKCTSFAAAVAYYALFSIFPLTVFLLSFLGFFVKSSQQRQNAVDTIFKLMGQSVSKGTLATQVNAFAGGRGALGIIGLLAALWSASSVFGAIRTGLNVVWNSNHSRPMVQSKLLDLAMVIGIGLLLLLSLIATGILTALSSYGSRIFGTSLGVLPHLLFALLYFVIPPAIAFVAFAVVYKVVPHAEIRLKDVWPGALVAAFALTVAQFGFSLYVANIAHYDKVYGSLGAAIAFLFFIYIAANILLFGGEVTKEYIDFIGGLKPSAEPNGVGNGSHPSLEHQATGFVKGLFVDETPHHDTSRPYEPGRTEPEQPAAALVKDESAHSQVAGENEKQPSGTSDGHSTSAPRRR